MPTINTENRNRYALVTGGTSGIGYELAKLLAKDGYNLILVARNEQLLNQTSDEFKQQYSVEVTPLAVDLFSCDAVDTVRQKVVEMGVTIDVLINDAGQGEWGPFLASDYERDCDIIQLNITSSSN
ncbi:MAG: SDR family NAD(P)-dependent oxidoreductase, partial [Chitinophagaceae bacterium]|nr:SDR family NAD(P)-dependent oxidoreductase [Chitinophagaceae bacterium]